MHRDIIWPSSMLTLLSPLWSPLWSSNSPVTCLMPSQDFCTTSHCMWWWKMHHLEKPITISSVVSYVLDDQAKEKMFWVAVNFFLFNTICINNCQLFSWHQELLNGSSRTLASGMYHRQLITKVYSRLQVDESSSIDILLKHCQMVFPPRIERQ